MRRTDFPRRRPLAHSLKDSAQPRCSGGRLRIWATTCRGVELGEDARSFVSRKGTETGTKTTSWENHHPARPTPSLELCSAARSSRPLATSASRSIALVLQNSLARLPCKLRSALLQPGSSAAGRVAKETHPAETSFCSQEARISSRAAEHVQPGGNLTAKGSSTACLRLLG